MPDARARKALARMAENENEAFRLQRPTMLSAAWGAELPSHRSGPPWTVPWTTDGQTMSPSASNPSIRLGLALVGELGNGASNTLDDVPAIPSTPVPPFKIPRIPLHLLSPPDCRESEMDEASEGEGGCYSRRSAVQQSALLEAIGEDSVSPPSLSLARAPSLMFMYIYDHLSHRSHSITTCFKVLLLALLAPHQSKIIV